VFGDWGQGTKDEANVLAQMRAAAPRFAVTVGDNAYPDGSEDDYGDLSSGHVFPPSYWPVLGGTVPASLAQGNHGFALTQQYLGNWPQDSTAAACAAGGCRYQTDAYPSIDGSRPSTYASAWYAFDFGNARFYILEAAWDDTNLGSFGAYKLDYDAHWNPATNAAEYQWLRGDLAAHTSTPLKFAFFHYPLHSDGGASSDTKLTGTSTSTLEGLLAANNVSIVFNGHAHIYERNLPQVPGSPMVSYVTGAGGAGLSQLQACSSFDAYALGNSNTSCNTPAQTKPHVFHFLRVDVNGATVTVTPTDETGLTFDVQTYTFPQTSGAISGTVTDAGTGQPIGGATVSYTGGSASTDANGVYTLSNAQPGTYSVLAGATGYVSQTATATVSSGATTILNFALAQSGAVTGMVTDAGNGQPIFGATVSYSGGSTTTDSGGHYTLSGVPQGTYTVSASAPGYVPGSATVTVSPGATATQDFALTFAPGTITGTVSDAGSGEPISGATVSCSCGSGGITNGFGSYTLSGITPGTYTVTASATGYAAQSASVTVAANSTTTQNFALIHPGIFSDGFESGDLSAWTTSTGLVVESSVVHGGSFAAEGNTTNGATYATKNLPSTYTTAYGRIWFDIRSMPSQVNLVRFRTAGGTSVAFLFVTTSGTLGLNANNVRFLSATTVSTGALHELELNTVVNGTSSTTQVWLDGTRVNDLSITSDLGTTPVGQFQIGEAATARTYDVVLDDAVFDTQFIP